MKEILKEQNTTYEYSRLAIISFMEKYPTKSDIAIAKRFNVNRSTIWRIRKSFKEKKEAAIYHGNKNKEPVNKTPKNEKEKIGQMYNEINDKVNEYRGTTDFKINVVDFYNDIYIGSKPKTTRSYSTVMNVLNDELIVTPNIHKKTRAKIRKLLRELTEAKENYKGLSEQEKKRIIDQLEVVIYKQLEVYEYGECVEIDACKHDFLGGFKSTLYHAQDNRTGRLLYAWMENEETNHGYLELLTGVFKLYGIPVLIKSDRRKGLFGDDEENGAVRAAVESLGTSISTDSDPRFKPNVELSFKTVQRALPYMLFKWGIKTIEDFNLNIHKYLNWFNKRYKRMPLENSMFRKVSDKEIFYGLLIPVKRKVCHGLVKYKGEYYAPYTEFGERVRMLEKSKVTLCYSKDNHLFFKGNGKYYEARIPDRTSLDDLEHYCIMNGLDVNEEAQSFHNIYLQNKKMSDSLNKRKDELIMKERMYQEKLHRLKIWEKNLFNLQKRLNERSKNK